MNQIGAALKQLARRYGVALAYEEIGGERREARPEDLRAVLGAMGVDVRDEGACRRSLHEFERERTRSLDPVLVVSCSRTSRCKSRLAFPLMKTRPAGPTSSVWKAARLYANASSTRTGFSRKANSYLKN